MTEPAQRLSPAEWAKAIFEHWRLQQPKGASVSRETFAAHAGLSRGGYYKVLDEDRDPRSDTMEKLLRVAPPHLKSLAPLPYGRPGIEPHGPGVEPLDNASAPSPTYPAAEGAQGKMTAEIVEVVHLMRTWPKEAQAALLNDALRKNQELIANPPEADRASK